MKAGVSDSQIDAVYNKAYADSPIVRFQNKPARVDDVAGTPFVDLYWQLNANNGHIIITSAIDNVMKGAASQAIQCINLRNGWDTEYGLVGACV